MFANRRIYSFSLTATGPLHLGTGEYQAFASKQGGNEENASYAKICRDHEGLPFIPASSLKGALRQRGVDLGLENKAGFAALFGEITAKAGIKTGDEANGAMGLMLLHGRPSKEKTGVEDAPYARQLSLKNTFLAARTSIEPATGTAQDHRLYFQEMLPAGHVFEFTATVVAGGLRSEQDAEKIKAAKARVQARLDAACGVLETILDSIAASPLHLGRGKADGNGELAIKDGRILKQHYELNAHGDLVPVVQAPLDARPDETGGNGSAGFAKVQIQTFKLHCTGPFLIMDSSVSTGRDTHDPARDKSASGPQIKAQNMGANTPLVLGSSIAGVLRSRAGWLAAREMHALSGEEREAMGRAVSFLFGETGFAALCVLRALKVENAEPMDITSLRIDRFTGAPVDGALFTTRAFCGVGLSFALHLTSRPAARMADGGMAAVEKLYEALCKDVRENGLMLGAGTNKGFGWFENVERAGNGT
jgi:CRISPR/Cas system CMR subunit Cmr4 (Cas7 group RAMP superfamily)